MCHVLVGVRRGWRPFWTGGLDCRGYLQVLGLGSMFGVGGSGAGVVVSGGGVDVVDGVLLVVVCWWMDGVVLWGTGALVWWLRWGRFGLVGGVLALLGSAQLCSSVLNSASCSQIRSFSPTHPADPSRTGAGGTHKTKTNKEEENEKRQEAQKRQNPEGLGRNARY